MVDGKNSAQVKLLARRSWKSSEWTLFHTRVQLWGAYMMNKLQGLEWTLFQTRVQLWGAYMMNKLQGSTTENKLFKSSIRPQFWDSFIISCSLSFSVSSGWTKSYKLLPYHSDWKQVSEQITISSRVSNPAFTWTPVCSILNHLWYFFWSVWYLHTGWCDDTGFCDVIGFCGDVTRWCDVAEFCDVTLILRCYQMPE